MEDRANLKSTNSSVKASSYYRELLPLIRPQLANIAFALACTLAFTVCWPILAWLAGQIAGYIGEGNFILTWQVAFAAAAVFLFQGLMQSGQDVLMAKAALKIALDLRQLVYGHLQKLSLNYFEVAKTGDLAYRLTEDVDRIGEVINKLFHQFIPCILQLIVVLGYMIYLNWQLTLAALIIAPLMAFLIGAFGEQLLKFSRRSQNRISNLSALVIEVFSGIRLVQAFAAEEYEIGRFAQEAESNRRAKYRTEQIKAIQYFVVGFLEAVSVLFLLTLGSWQIAQGNLTGQEFVSYLAAVAMLIDPVRITTENYNEFKQGQASADRVFELLEVEPLVINQPEATNLTRVEGRVEYRQISFSYSSEQPVLKNLSLVAQPGEMIALVGHSGAGKTTLVNLLPRFYQPQSGQILIDGVDIETVTLKSLRRQIGIVPQETTIFSGTIAENIAFGQREFDLAEVKKCAQLANADQFISQLSQGYYSYVGERGVSLSGGQRQRIAIARAIFYNPRILILDEATSALDSESEALVQEALERIMKQRTVFVIAHRLATVRRATRILVLEKGKIIESGNHAELLSHNGQYARFYAQQFES